MKKIIGVGVSLICMEWALSASGGTDPTIVVYKTIDTPMIKSADLNLHIFYPPNHKPTDQTPAIVFFSGGGWIHFSPKHFYQQARYIASKGMVAICAEYRTKNEHGTTPKESVKDGKSAMRWVRSHATELGVDPERIAAGGGSAGGHIAVATGTLDVYNEDGEDLSISCRPDALVLFNPVYDNSPDGYGYDRVAAYWEEFSPMNNINSNMPPALVMLGTEDAHIPVGTAEAFKHLMENVGVRSDLILYKGEKHGFYNKSKPLETNQAMEDFLMSLGYIPTPIVQRFNEGSEWRQVDKSSVVIQSGSALDLSGLVDKPAGKYGRAVIGSDGSLEFEKNPSHPVRFFGFNRLVLLRDLQHFSDEEFKDRAIKLAKAIRRQGYNMVRLNDPGRFLTQGSVNDMEINPIMMDRFDFLMAELKKEGIYSHLMIMVFGLYNSNGGRGDGTFYRNRNSHKLGMYLGVENLRQRFHFGVKEVLEHVNPYTGVALKDDPAIAIVEFYNEQELGTAYYRIIQKSFQDKYPELTSLLSQKWQTWLQDRFRENPPDELLEELNGTSLAQATLSLAEKNNTFIANEFGLFIADLQKNQVTWYENIVRKTGYRGITVQHNQSRRLGEALVRWETMGAVDIHSYFCHPKKEPGIKGHAVDQESSIETLADYWREAGAGRFSGRPFFVSEFNHAFGNPYQYEGGLVFAAYSALQGFDALMRQAYAVLINASDLKMNQFSIGNNPVTRASEFLSACLFARGDVQKSPHLVELELSQEFTETGCTLRGAISPKDTLSSLVAGFCSAFPWAETLVDIPVSRQPDLTIVPSGTARVNTQEWFSNVIDEGGDISYIGKVVAEMKRKGILSPDNLTDPEKGIYQSDTGEITMRSEEKLLKVSTARSEAVCILAGRSEKLNHLKVISSSVPASIAVCSVDGKPLETSTRMVLLYSTAVANKGMERSEDGRSFVKIGDELVTLMRAGMLQLTLENSMGGNMALYALGLDGSRREKLPLEYKNGKIFITFDTSKIESITPFFELGME